MNDFAVPYTDFRAQNAGVREDLRAAFDGVLDSGQYVQGPNVSGFEREFADYVGAPFSTGVANGTCSLHLVLRSLGVGPGDEVIRRDERLRGGDPQHRARGAGPQDAGSHHQAA